MKPTKSYRSAFLFTAASLFSWGISYSQLIIEVDPTTPIPSTHNQVFNTEWNTDDNKESWTANNQFTFAAGTPTGGVLTGTVTPTGNDPNISLNFGANLVPTSPNTIIEFRIQKQTTDNSRIDIFWADNNGGINAARMVTINPPSTTTDGAFHTYRITFDGQIAGPLSMIRFDIASDVTANGKTVSVDYFRIYTQPSTNPNLRSWDPNATGGTALGGSGTWDTSSNFWFNGAQTFWPDPTASTGMQEADFAGAGGTVDIIPTGVTASNVEFFANGYTLTGGPLTIDGSSPTIRTLINVNNTVIESQLIASSSLSLAGTGGIVLRADNTLLTVPINASINRLGIAHDGALGSGAVSLQNFVIALDGNRTIANDVAFTSARLIIENNAMGTGLVVGDLTMNGNFALSSSSAPSDFFLRKNLTINGIVSGNNGGRGMIFGGDSGILTLSNSSNSFTGNIFWQAPIVLAVASDEALGGSANTLNFSAAGATANGTLRLLADFDSNRNILINNQQLATANLVTGQIDTNGFNSTWTGKISPTSTTPPTVAAQGGFTKLGLGRLTLSPSSPNTYTGPTTVNAGVLELNGGSAIPDKGRLNIATGAMVSVPTGINEVVDTLYLNGVQQSPGVYGSTTSPATNQNDTYFEGGGTLTVGSTFATWLAANAPATGFNTDSDDDGVPNGVENVLGTSPNTSSAGLTQVSATANSVTFQHTLNPTIASDVSFSYEWSSDLVEWRASEVSNAAGTIGTIVPSPPASGVVSVTTTQTGTAANKLFTRIRANNP